MLVDLDSYSVQAGSVVVYEYVSTNLVVIFIETYIFCLLILLFRKIIITLYKTSIYLYPKLFGIFH